MDPAHAPPPAADKRDKLTRSQSARTVQPGGAHTLASLLPQVPRDAAYPDGGARVRWQAKSLETRARCLCASYAMPPGLALASLSRAQGPGHGFYEDSEVAGALPPLPIRWLGGENDVELSQLHLLLRVDYTEVLFTDPSTLSFAGLPAGSGPDKLPTVASVGRDMREAQCAIALGPLVREWQMHATADGSSVVQTVTAELRRHGLPVVVDPMSTASAHRLHVSFELEMSNVCSARSVGHRG